MAFPVVYTVSQLLGVLPLSRNTIYMLLESGELVGTKVGVKWLIPEPNVLAFLKMQDETPGMGTEGNVTVLSSSPVGEAHA